MATMSEERRREMEEEMSRFEQEIAAPAIAAATSAAAVTTPLPAPPPPPPGLSSVSSTCAPSNVPTPVKSAPVKASAPVVSSASPVVTSTPAVVSALPRPPPPPTAPSSISVTPPPPPPVAPVPAVASTPPVTLAPPPPPPPPPRLTLRTTPDTIVTVVREAGRLSPEKPTPALIPHHIPQVRLPPMQPMQPHPPPPPPLMPNHIQFIPHQLHRQHVPMHRPPLRAMFGGMRGPGPGLPPGVMRPFPMQPGHAAPPPPPQGVHVATIGMGMPGPGFVPQVAQMNPSLSLPHIVHQRYMPAMHTPVFTNAVPSRPVPETCMNTPEIAPSPAVYAAPPMKSQMEKEMEHLASANGDSFANIIAKATAAYGIQKLEKSIRENEEKIAAAQLSSPPTGEEVLTKKKEKKRKVIRVAGGQTWEDNSLQEWDSDDFRIFCGDLGNDVTDEVLTRAFSKYPSFIKSKVIRDKRTNKTKGFGFVSFKDPQDFIKAMKEMNGRYVGSRPIKLRKSTWKDRNIEVVRKKQKEKEKLALL